MNISKKLQDLRKYHFNEKSFKDLMSNRIKRVLIICSNYDYFMLEDDGRIDEQIFDEYTNLNLPDPPQFLQCNSYEKAIEILNTKKINLIISLQSSGSNTVLDLTKKVKKQFPRIPVVMLTPNTREINIHLFNQDLSDIDHIFCWLGNTDILLAIVKVIEDKMNVEHDVGRMGVQAILLVEDNIRFYSSYLPSLYKLILKQSQIFMHEALNQYRENLMLRGRPKILLATNYEEAVLLYEKYKNNLLGIISDIGYKREGEMDNQAGFSFFDHVRSEDKFVPFLLQSSQTSNELIAQTKGIDYLSKQSESFLMELCDFVYQKLSFGDFIFRDASTEKEIDRAVNLLDMQRKLPKISEETLAYHFNRNDFSRWLNARAIFPVAEMIKHLRLSDFKGGIPDARAFLINAIESYRLNQSRDVIAKFDRTTYDEFIIYARIGNGFLGGKGRGLAFINNSLKKNHLSYKYDDVIITIPRTVIISTDIFDTFMEENRLYQTALSDMFDEELVKIFVEALFSDEVTEDLRVFLDVVKFPIAIRSSSLLEDGQYQPFAGVYSTYMIPYLPENKDKMLKQLIDAIKCVYASVYFKSTKAYMAATSNSVAEEKMAIILQEVCGSQYGDVFYPTMSGVARSVNFYPISPEKSDEGIVKLAYGLGKAVVEGGATLRFSPKHPERILQLTSPEIALRETQNTFFALDLKEDSFHVSSDDGVNIRKLKIREAESHTSMKFASSTYDLQNHVIRDGSYQSGKKIITFASVLKYKKFPLCEIISDLLELGHREMNAQVEIEFAVNLDVPVGIPLIFNFLQIRPVVEYNDGESVEFENEINEKTILLSQSALGNGIIKEIKDIVYVKPESFSAADSQQIAECVDSINSKFAKEGKNYVLIGPGRWGSSDSWLGIPVKWTQISAARIIVEMGLENYRIDPSQGTHFFQNLTSFKVGYFTINPYMNEGYINIDFLNKREAIYEDKFIRHVQLPETMLVKIDGKNNKAIILIP